MKISKDKYIILEIIPTNIDPKYGDIAQLSALKIDGLKLVDRFDYRLKNELINIPDIINMTNYDNDKFKYTSSSKRILNSLKKFIGDLPLLIIDNTYTNNYLSDLDNKKISVFKLLDLELTDDVFNKLMVKYNLEPSNYLVDLLYEALIMESNNESK